MCLSTSDAYAARLAAHHRAAFGVFVYSGFYAALPNGDMTYMPAATMDKTMDKETSGQSKAEATRLAELPRLVQMFLAGTAITVKRNAKGAITEQIVNPFVQQMFQGKPGGLLAKALIKQARTAEDPALRQSIEELGIDLDSWEDMINNAD